MKWFSKRFAILIVVSVVAVFVSGSIAQRKMQTPYLETAVHVVFAPFQMAATTLGNGIKTMLHSSAELITVYRNNEGLRQENSRLTADNIVLREMEAENMRLKLLLDYKLRNPQYELITATVIGRDFGTWSNAIVLNRGAGHGVAKDMTVVTPYGLVGAVVNVTQYTAKVQLLTDPRSAVGALVQRPESRVASIVEGNATKPSTLRLVNISREADIIKGDQLVTSGFGGIYPKGLAIGEVTELANDEGGLLKYAVIRPAVNFDRLEEVQIVLKVR